PRRGRQDSGNGTSVGIAHPGRRGITHAGSRRRHRVDTLTLDRLACSFGPGWRHGARKCQVWWNRGDVMAFLPLRRVPVAEAAGRAYDRWLGSLADELSDPGCDRNELCRRILTEL